MKSRLDKILAANGLGSRNDIKKLLRKKNICVNGLKVTNPSFLAETASDIITIDDEIFTPKENIYIMLNKPSGCITSTEDPFHKTVNDYLKPPFDKIKLFSIGRLDIDTEGLIILTNDGILTHKIISPKSKIEKTYYLEFLHDPDEEQIIKYTACFEKGIVLKSGYKFLPAKFKMYRNITGSGKKGFLITITEGKHHQIKKMCSAVENSLVYLKRIEMASIKLDTSLKKGEYRELTSEEVKSIKKYLD